MNIAFSVLDSKAIMLEKLSSAGKHILLGGNSEAPRKYYLSDEIWINGDSCRIAISSSDFGQSPMAIFSRESENLFVGHDCDVSIINTIKFDIIKILTTKGVVFRLMSIVNSNNVLIVHEIGLKCVDLRGSNIWDLSTDIISDFIVIDEKTISIKTIGEKIPRKISLVDGKIL